MDIQEWLATTADRAAPEASNHGRIPNPFRAHSHSPDSPQRARHSYRRRKRNRASSDSSIIAPRSANHRRVLAAAPRSLLSKRATSAESAGSECQGSAYSSRCASQSHESAPEKTYERRPRHKTRPDRYEPKQRKRERNHEAHMEKKSDRKRRKSHRSGDGGRTAGLVQSFQLKTRPRNSRLTMTPGATAGLFKHGRASAQVTGRGGGLPDLVFNEMRFLQRPAEHQDVPATAEDQPQQSKKDRKRPNPGDISAYFNAKKPSQRHHDEHVDSPGDGEGRRADRRRSPDRDNPRSHAPSVGLPSRPFLGFGSKGGQPDYRQAHSKHTSYLSWSQTPSLRKPSSPKRRVGSTPARVDARTIKDLSVQSPRLRRGKEDPSNHRQPVSQPQTSLRGQWVQTRRAKRPEVLGKYQPGPTVGELHVAKPRSTAKTMTSQSLPRAVAKSSNTNQQHSQDPPYDGYRTSDILQIHEHANVSHGHESERLDSTVEMQAEKENQDPLSSFSVDQLLEKARHVAVLAATPPKHAAPKHDLRPMRLQSACTTPTANAPSPPLQIRGEARYAPTRRRQLPESDRRAKIVSRREALPSQYAGQSVERSPLVGAQNQNSPGQRSFDVQLQQYQHAPEDDERLDDDPVLGYGWSIREPVYASLQQAGDFAYGSRRDNNPGILETQSDQLRSETTCASQPLERAPSLTLAAPNLSVGRSVSVGHTLQGEQVTVAPDEDGSDGLGGFWRPNMLY